MKAIFKSISQEEFDAKRPSLIKAVAGSHFKVSIRNANESKPTEAKPPVYKAQGELLAELDEKFLAMLQDVKAEIEVLLG